MSTPSRMPVLFVSDFGPMPAVETDSYTAALGRIGQQLPRPRAIVAMSGHWLAQGALAVTTSPEPPIIYDYYGFPREYYEVTWPCTGAPEVAARALTLLGVAGIRAQPDPVRGIDHGAWCPLRRVYPEADIPIVQITLPAGDVPRNIMRVGQALAPLRDDGVLLVGAGTLIHNLRRVHFHGKNDPPDDWAQRFDDWMQQRLDPPNTDDLEAYRALAPDARLAAPTTEHFDPLFFVLGAASGEPVTHLHRDIKWGNGSLRIFALGEG